MTADPRKLYESVLLTVKENIKTSRVAREVALNYHKTKHRALHLPTLTRKPRASPSYRWPVDNPVFNRILKTKLESSLPGRPLPWSPRLGPKLTLNL